MTLTNPSSDFKIESETVCSFKLVGAFPFYLRCAGRFNRRCLQHKAQILRTESIARLTDSVWPKGVRAAAAFTFDNDEESGLIDAFGPDKMFYVSQGYYDTNAGTQRVLRILKRHQVKA